MSPSPDSCIVAGAGIGGLTVALKLARAGAPVTVLEKRTALVEAGAGIQVSPNASRVLIDLGLGAALRRRAVEPGQLSVRRLSDGRQLAAMPLGETMRARHGAPYLVILRADLHDILLDAARAQPGIALLVGRQVTGFTERDDHAEVHLETGNGASQTLRTPLLIGADGVWSRLRNASGGAAPRFSGFEAWRCVVQNENVPEALQAKQVVAWLGRGAHIVHYPVSGGSAWNLVVIVRSRTAVDGWGMLMEQGKLERFIAGLDTPALADLRSLLRAGENWRLWSLHDAEPPARWGTAHTTLLGDAAHPVLPFLAQGGAMAIEDAAVLASALQAHGGRTETALPAYEKARHARVSRVVAESRRNGRAFHTAGPIALVRDLILRRLGEKGFADRYDWLYGWRPD